MQTKYIKIIPLAAVLLTTLAQPAMAADDMSGMDHSHMQHDTAAPDKKHDMDAMDHSQMNHDTVKPANKLSMSMQGGKAPANARDPHAYSGGYDFGPNAPLRLADEAYRATALFNRLEHAQSRNNSHLTYDLTASIGKDYDQLLIKAEGEVDSGAVQESRTELLWAHAVSTFWNTQVGVRIDGGAEPSQNWLALGVRGLAPYWFEVDATAYISEQGNSAIRVEAEYELLLTQKLILQPRIEANLFGQQDTLRSLGSGLSNVSTGLRLRYEIKREFAPYVGLEWNNTFGGTANFARVAGDPTSTTSAVAGVRIWF